jgi:unsaturated chondroitin disaccharide hydrolase
MVTSDARTEDAATILRPALEVATGIVRRNIATFDGWYPGDTTVQGRYRPRPGRGTLPVGGNHGWTTSFWPGMLWLAYEATGGDDFRRKGEWHVADFAGRVEREIDLETHDLGFLYALSCIAPWRLAGSERGFRAALGAADHLMRRYLPAAGIVQAWGDLQDPRQRGRTIIDSLKNMPLLFWAEAVTSDPVFGDAARRHVAQLRDHIIRPDDTTFHTFYWDPETGVPLRGATEQGHQDDSCWARGQAWGIYGFALCGRYTGDDSFLESARRCADYFLEHLPADGVVSWDLVFADGSGVQRDSSAAAIAACGLDELARLLPDGEGRERYRAAALEMLTSLAAGYATPADSDSDALLQRGVYDLPKSVGVDEGTLWGDYFYLEALVRLTDPGWKPYW